ncbi:MAG: FIST C-terminal domain-containing protein [Candidatus Eisenbacteria bacterium]|uniref:FIST C-terminal domain-containing protein n=1 Tax=Eiseniibacteriota bacterium TaxID=2212470 RepID=A0A948RTU6_UNCEI|nr:FIST C-terminal domain-containing protein [Candidatus Eisenbacteria bacterium]MBU1948278.1 FIST C-terminal domain-containing protein [Candidatus Eisenbacteria bacterium]MBU2689866.1 FIST C-terminal domain-containing protein [Candidatus Eisenbacteria bacterium]
MKVEQRHWSESEGWSEMRGDGLGEKAQLVFVFAGTSIIEREDLLSDLYRAYPNAHIFGCSTAGEICSTEVSDDTLVATAIEFKSTRFQIVTEEIPNSDQSRSVGRRLARAFDPKGLVHIFLLSDGLNINGSELVKGLLKNLPKEVTATGGLSGDGTRFGRTFVIKEGKAKRNLVAAIGFYGGDLHIGYASLGGWDTFGPERLVTKSEGNILYQLDGKSALVLYKEYLGEHAGGLPSTALLFPLNVKVPGNERAVVRTILAIDEEKQSMTFAGDIPEGSYAQLMRANFDRLIDGAAGAATASYEAGGSRTPDLAILISCVGRKLVLNQRVEEEIECVRDVLGQHTVLTGFYSYGEISPFSPNAKCELHNQTMTITTMWEDEKAA